MNKKYLSLAMGLAMMLGLGAAVPALADTNAASSTQPHAPWQGKADMTNRGPRMMGQRGKGATSTPPFAGNGQPITAGNVSAINGATLTVTTKSNVTYTVDASNAKIIAGQNATATISNIVVGDSVVVQGAVNGTHVTATTIIDRVKPVNNFNASTTPKRGMMGGFFGGIGSFFGHLFGF